MAHDPYYGHSVAASMAPLASQREITDAQKQYIIVPPILRSYFAKEKEVVELQARLSAMSPTTEAYVEHLRHKLEAAEQMLCQSAKVCANYGHDVTDHHWRRIIQAESINTTNEGRFHQSLNDPIYDRRGASSRNSFRSLRRSASVVNNDGQQDFFGPAGPRFMPDLSRSQYLARGSPISQYSRSPNDHFYSSNHSSPVVTPAIPLRQVNHVHPSIVSYNVVTARDPRTEEYYNKLDVRVKPQKFFKVGKVIVTLWSEPLGDEIGCSSSQDSFMGKYGEHIYSKIRRFVIVREGQGYCLALPIVIYGGQGVAMRGVKKSDHGIIYHGHKLPLPDPSEMPNNPHELPMREHAIRVRLDDPTETLKPMSRINYGRMYTIEHNLRVRKIGTVDPKSTDHLLRQWFDVLGPSVLESHLAPAPTQQHTNSRTAEELFKSKGGQTLLHCLQSTLPYAHRQDLARDLQVPAPSQGIHPLPATLHSSAGEAESATAMQQDLQSRLEMLMITGPSMDDISALKVLGRVIDFLEST